MKIAAMLLVLLAAGCTSSRFAELDREIAAHTGKSIAVSYYDFRSGELIERNARETFHAASTMKVPVMFGIFDGISRGALTPEQPVVVHNEFVSILDGSTYALDPKEDSDPELYAKEGSAVSLDELVRRMVGRSSNLATNLVIGFVGAPRIMELMRSLGANDIRVLRGVEDDKAYRAGMNNTTTAHDLMLIFRALGERTVISADASARMLAILAAQEHNDGIPAGLPKGTPVAHKTGSITAIAHDAGIVTRPDGSQYVLVVLTRGFQDYEEAQRTIAAISKDFWSLQ
jgi:beta-lactamase class A